MFNEQDKPNLAPLDTIRDLIVQPTPPFWIRYYPRSLDNIEDEGFSLFLAGDLRFRFSLHGESFTNRPQDASRIETRETRTPGGVILSYVELPSPEDIKVSTAFANQAHRKWQAVREDFRRDFI